MYQHITTNHYAFAPDTNLIRFNKANNSIKFRQIVYTITSVNEIFNGYEYLTIYNAEAVRDGLHKRLKHTLEVTIDDFGNYSIVRSIYHKDI